MREKGEKKTGRSKGMGTGGIKDQSSQWCKQYVYKISYHISN